jgi:RNA polymerase sigma factor (sigma-70 family)
MLTQYAKGAAVAADGRDVDPVLLSDTQAYLEARSRGETPSPRQSEAWQRFYLACTPLIEQCIATYPISEEDRRDCTQEVWKAIIGKLSRFRYDPHRGRISTWLHALTRNKAVDVIRRRRRHSIESLSDRVEKSLPGHEPDPAAECERHQLQTTVRDVLDRLSTEAPPRSYEVLYLRWIEGRTVPEIAVALGLTPEQVHYRHHRVMRKFRLLTGLSWE